MPLVLAAQERSTLQPWAKRPSSAQALALRCRIVLACAEGVSNSQVARQLGVARSTVTKWRARFVADRLEDWSMSQGRVHPARSATSRSSRCCW